MNTARGDSFAGAAFYWSRSLDFWDLFSVLGFAFPFSLFWDKHNTPRRFLGALRAGYRSLIIRREADCGKSRDDEPNISFCREFWVWVLVHISVGVCLFVFGVVGFQRFLFFLSAWMALICLLNSLFCRFFFPYNVFSRCLVVSVLPTGLELYPLVFGSCSFGALFHLLFIAV